MRWIGLSFAPVSKHNERFEHQYRQEHPPEFSLTLLSSFVHHLSSPNTFVLLKPLSRSRNVHRHRHIYIYINIQVIMYHLDHNRRWKEREVRVCCVWCGVTWFCVVLCLLLLLFLSRVPLLFLYSHNLI